MQHLKCKPTSILCNKTLKKDLQKKKSVQQKFCKAKKVCSKRSAKQKKVVLVLDLNPRQYPEQLQGGVCFILWLCNGIRSIFTYIIIFNACSGQTK